MLNRKFTLLLLLAVAVLTGCSGGNDPAAPAGADGPATALVRGEIPGGAGGFELAAKVARGADDPAPGTLLIRGANLAYDMEAGALAVDLTVTNTGDAGFAEPVMLTFVRLLPAGVTVVDPDNDEHGPGASITFAFENDDAMWTPGEESLPRTVRFAVDAGTAIGFVARIDVETSPTGGTIGGLVWNDLDEDGELDDGENGVPGVSLALHGGDAASPPLQTSVTGADGTYRFDGLETGFYTVTRLPRGDLMGTTPPELAVALPASGDTVASFLMADFGVLVTAPPPLQQVQVGDYVHAKGWYEPEPDRLVAGIVSICRRSGGDPAKHDDGYDRDRDRDCAGADSMSCWGRLAGPVTGFDREAGTVTIMGTTVHLPDPAAKCDCDENEPGMRLRVDAVREVDGEASTVVACGRLHAWKGHRDRVKGFVQEVLRDDEDHVTGVMILDTLVEFPPRDAVWR